MVTSFMLKRPGGSIPLVQVDPGAQSPFILLPTLIFDCSVFTVTSYSKQRIWVRFLVYRLTVRQPPQKARIACSQSP